MQRFYDSDDDDLIVVEKKATTSSAQEVTDPTASSNSDSDSSVDEHPLVPRTRCTRSRQTANAPKKDVEEEDVFACRVDETFAMLKSTTVKDIERLAPEDNEPLIKRRGRRKVMRSPSPPEAEPDLVEEQPLSQNSMNASAISISPPVSPSPLLKKKKKRNTKAVKKLNRAIEIMSKANDIIKPVKPLSPIKRSRDLDIVDLDSPVKSRDIQLRIRSRSGIQRLTLPKNESFASAVTVMARHENVPESSIQLYLNDQFIEPFNTPAQIGVGIADFIECLIHRSGAAKKPELDDPNALKLKVQSKASKTHTVISIRKDQPLGRLMQNYCETVNAKFGSLRFQFDGEDILPNETAEDLDLETDFCIDVM